MSDDNVEGVSEEILSHASSYIKELLKSKKLSTEVRAQLEIQSYFLTILTLDHERISQIYPWARSQMTRQMKWSERWEKLAWLIVPTVLTGIILFVGQFIYFWTSVVPRLMITP